MKILLTNDDGIEAAGLAASYQAVTEFFAGDAEVIVVAPDRGRSECSHAVSPASQLTLKQTADHWYSLSGTPVDCVRIAIHSVAAEPSLVISGVNAGANLGTCLMVSGTFAAARESAMQGIDAIAVSQYRHPDHPQTWDHIGRWMIPILERFAAGLRGNSQRVGNAKGRLWNVNFPANVTRQDLPPITQCDVDQNPIPRQIRIDEGQVYAESDFQSRPRSKNHDVDLCFNGAITISPLTSRSA